MGWSDDHVELYRDDAGEWRWRRVAPNGEVVADSAEGYTRLEDCRAGAERQGVEIFEIREPEDA